MDKHLDWLKDNKCESIFVNVLVENENTISFYETLGFKKYNKYGNSIKKI